MYNWINTYWQHVMVVALVVDVVLWGLIGFFVVKYRKRHPLGKR
jgi:hypothetical protein